MTKIVDRLTDKAVLALKPHKKAYRIADGLAMYLLVTPTGGKLWRLKFRLAGKERTLALGVYPDVSSPRPGADATRPAS